VPADVRCTRSFHVRCGRARGWLVTVVAGLADPYVACCGAHSGADTAPAVARVAVAAASAAVAAAATVAAGDGVVVGGVEDDGLGAVSSSKRRVAADAARAKRNRGVKRDAVAATAYCLGFLTTHWRFFEPFLGAADVDTSHK